MANIKVAPDKSIAVDFLSSATLHSLQPKNDEIYAHQLPDNNGNEMKELRPQLLSKISRSSFQNLVIYNERGQPSIDINRLVYKPRKVKHSKEKQQLSWYLPDYIFIISNFLCLTFAAYFFQNGLTLVSWRNSMKPFALRNCNLSCNCDNEINEEICQTIKKEENEFNEFSSEMGPYTIIRFYGFNDVSKYGFCLLSFGFFNIFNAILGVSACLTGSKALMISHLVFDVILFASEVGLVTVMYLFGRCDERDIKIVKLFLDGYVKRYTKGAPNDLVGKSTTEMDLIQISLTCCGVGNWTDYLPRSTWENGKLIERAVVERYNLDKSDLIIPSSCCRQWWARNIYHAHDAHMRTYLTTTQLQAHQIRQRINHWGCLPKMVGLCKNMVAMVGTGGMVAWTIHFSLSVVRHLCAFLQMQAINKLIREGKQIFRRKEADFRGGDVANKCKLHTNSQSTIENFSEGSEPGTPHFDNITGQIPQPPKESEIANMKTRQDFNRFQVLMRTSHVYDWINSGQAFVEGRNILTGKGTVKAKEPILGNRKNILVRHENLTNMQVIQQFTALPDHLSEQEGDEHSENMKTSEKGVSAFEALKLVAHVKQSLNTKVLPK